VRRAEIDIIARHGDVLVFAEVKARRSSRYGGAAAAVTPVKQQAIVQAAMQYISENFDHWPACRFDVITVSGDRAQFVDEHIQSAFEAVT